VGRARSTSFRCARQYSARQASARAFASTKRLRGPVHPCAHRLERNDGWLPLVQQTNCGRSIGGAEGRRTHNPSVVGSSSAWSTSGVASLSLRGPRALAAVARALHSRLPHQILQGPFPNFPDTIELRKSPGRGSIVRLSGFVWLEMRGQRWDRTPVWHRKQCH
jgi:hypothetical protein